MTSYTLRHHLDDQRRVVRFRIGDVLRVNDLCVWRHKDVIDPPGKRPSLAIDAFWPAEQPGIVERLPRQPVLRRVRAKVEIAHQDHVLTTHDLSEADRLCDRLAILDRGRLVVEGTPAELKDKVAAEHDLPATLESVFMTWTGRSLDDDVEDEEND